MITMASIKNGHFASAIVNNGYQYRPSHKEKITINPNTVQNPNKAQNYTRTVASKNNTIQFNFTPKTKIDPYESLLRIDDMRIGESILTAAKDFSAEMLRINQEYTGVDVDNHIENLKKAYTTSSEALVNKYFQDMFDYFLHSGRGFFVN